METKIKDMEKKNSARPSTTRALTESALMIALATVLGVYAVFKLPNGGSVTIGSMIPIILVAYKYPFGWSLAVALAYSLIQMLTGFYAPPVENLISYTMMVLLDYVIAFGVLCLAGPLYKVMRDKLPVRVSMMVSTLFCFTLRFVCHLLSGIIIWGVYAPAGQPVWLYSLLYNGSYMLCEGLVSSVILYASGPKLAAYFLGEKE